MRGLGLGLLALAACAGQVSEGEVVRRLELGRAQHQDAATRAPELFERYEAAQKRALSARPDTAERADRESEARAWLEAALADAERQRLSEARLQVERETAQLEASVLEEERARDALARRAEHEAARAIAEREEQLALARAALQPQHRIKLSREEIDAATQALIARASLVLVAAQAYGVTDAQRAPVEAKLSRARSLAAKSPDEAFAAADDSLFGALALLGKLRTGEAAAASDDERAALAESVIQSGAALTRNDRGLAALIDRAFAGSKLTAGSVRVLSHLCSLAQAYPRGPVQLALAHHPAALAESRGNALREQLGQLGCAGPRYQVVAAASGSAEQLELTWLAY